MSALNIGDRVTIKDGARYHSMIRGGLASLASAGFTPSSVYGVPAIVKGDADDDGDVYVETIGDGTGVYVTAEDLIPADAPDVLQVGEFDTAAAGLIAKALIEADFGLGMTTAANGGFIAVLEVDDGRTEAFEVSVRRLEVAR